VALSQSQQRLHAAQALEDAIGEQALDHLGAGRTDAPGLDETPGAVVREEGLRLGRQMILHPKGTAVAAQSEMTVPSPLAPIRRKRTGAITPKIDWLLYAENQAAPLR